MLTIDKLLANKTARRSALFDEYNDQTDELRKLRAVEAPTAADFAKIDEIKERKAAISGQVDTIDAEIAELKREMDSDEQLANLQKRSEPAADLPAYDQVARVGSEPRTYSRESSANGASFFRDAWGFEKGDVHARERIERHAREVKVHKELSERATTTGSFGGLVVPQYLVDMAAQTLRNGRPLANVVNRHQLPAQGMNLVIPRGTTGASAAPQTAENTAVSNTDEAWADLTVPIRTISGQQDVSRQALERGSGVDQLIYSDLARAYMANVGTQVISGTGASGQVLGILNTAGISSASAFGAAVSATNLNSKIAGASVAVWSAGQGIAADVLVMHPRRWGWLTGQVDTTGRPIVQANANIAFNTAAVGSATGDELGNSPTPFVGVHSSGLPVLLDLNIPTNVGTNLEDVLLAVDSDELHLWEDGDGMPRQLSFEQTAGGSLTTKLVVYGYVAFTAGRYPQAVAKVGGLDATAGNGLIAPVF
jgi:HK97 family phage major capsid protein